MVGRGRAPDRNRRMKERHDSMQEARMNETLKLPELAPSAWHPIERLLAHRRSVREFTDKPLSLAELGRLLWAAQGVTDASGLRSAPSAGALYPLEVTIVTGGVDGLQPG